ncbi:RNA dependent RNA polymerase-domain-containing protein [Mycena capillaripes]|nr:RNA dependent RNA polymerase-domain-containing protein [Mycena capillaripes]
MAIHHPPRRISPPSQRTRPPALWEIHQVHRRKDHLRHASPPQQSHPPVGRPIQVYSPLLWRSALPRDPDQGHRRLYLSFTQSWPVLNGIQYRFYHHSNSQLRSRSCFLREANSDAELDERIYRLGDFQRLMSAAKRAKRIGLLFSEAQLDYNLNPIFVKDIEDIRSGDELFSDGCGLISRWLAIQLAKSKKVIFRGVRYTPCVFQIRYLGYKGVLMLHPQLDANRRIDPE